MHRIFMARNESALLDSLTRLFMKAGQSGLTQGIKQSIGKHWIFFLPADLPESLREVVTQSGDVIEIGGEKGTSWISESVETQISESARAINFAEAFKGMPLLKATVESLDDKGPGFFRVQSIDGRFKESYLVDLYSERCRFEGEEEIV